MSKQNGDKTRFGRQRKRKLLRRKRQRAFWLALGIKSPRVVPDSLPAA